MHKFIISKNWKETVQLHLFTHSKFNHYTGFFPVTFQDLEL